MENKEATIQVSLQQVKDAVRRFELQLEKGIRRTVLVNEDHSINFELLKPFIGGLPDSPFYMSRETYEIFPEEEQHIPRYLDMVQQAVDTFIYDHRRAPIVPADVFRRIDTKLLVDQGYLQEEPPMLFYMTDEEEMITHKKPQ